MLKQACFSRRELLGAPIAISLIGEIVNGQPLQKEKVNQNTRLFTFLAGQSGNWTITKCKTLIGDPWPTAAKLQIFEASVATLPQDATWALHGVTSNERYVTREEKGLLVARQAALGRPQATHAALIPIRKNAKWWSLTQEERRAIFEEQSHHNQIGLKYLPAIARRLHHCRDLTENAPFDFITLFDYARADASAFEDLVSALRLTEEWKYVEREVDIRLVRDNV